MLDLWGLLLPDSRFTEQAYEVREQDYSDSSHSAVSLRRLTPKQKKVYRPKNLQGTYAVVAV